MQFAGPTWPRWSFSFSAAASAARPLRWCHCSNVLNPPNPIVIIAEAAQKDIMHMPFLLVAH